jgi:hypothetical protein
MTKYSRLMWSWTMGHESLFDLDIEDLCTFQLLVLEAIRGAAATPAPATQIDASTAPSDGLVNACTATAGTCPAPAYKKRHPYDGDMA